MSIREKIPLVHPGNVCHPDARGAESRASHHITDPAEDEELQRVHRWLMERPITELMRSATDSSVKYVLDGARTWRFDLMDSAVDSDERATVGTKLQYHIIQMLGLQKAPPLDTSILGVPVEIKGTVRTTWMIPREGQCEVTLLVRIDAKGHRFAAWLMRTHRAWLTGGNGNRDLKRSPLAEAFRQNALLVVPWTDLPPQPLRLLTRDQLDVVFGGGGLKRRLIELFKYLPEVVIPRASIEIVGAGLGDPMKRARETKVDLRVLHDLIVLVGTWSDERDAASKLGFDISDESWVTIPASRFAEKGIPIPRFRV